MDRWQSLISLLSLLIVTVGGFVVPLFALLLSLFPAGLKKLQQKYKDEEKMIEENIKTELNKKGDSSIESLMALSLKGLKKNKKQIQVKLFYLTPQALTLRIGLPLLVSLAFLGAGIFSNFCWLVVSLILSVGFFVYAIYGLVYLVGVFTEVRSIIVDDEAESRTKIIELLSVLADKSDPTAALFISPDDINVYFREKKITPSFIESFSVNNPHKIAVAINLGGEKMAKHVELGLEFPVDVIVEKSSNIASITNAGTTQIIRFKQDLIQSSTYSRLGEIKLTFIKTGTFLIPTFIKGENIKNKKISFKIAVVE